MGFIYLITNLITDEKYVGQTYNSIYVRFAHHYKDYKRFPERKLYKNMNEYGINNFDIKKLEECSDELLDEREIYWIDKLDTFHNGLNDTIGGSHGKIGEKEKLQIIDFYKQVQNYNDVIQKFNIDRKTIYTILKDNNIKRDSSSEILQKRYGKKIARIDPNTGEILQEYSSQMEAGRWLKSQGLSNIEDLRKLSYHLGKATKDNTKVGGYYWRNLSDQQKSTITELETIVSRDEYKDLIRRKPFTQIAKQFNISDKTVSRWCLKYNLPSTKKEISKYSDEEWAEL